MVVMAVIMMIPRLMTLIPFLMTLIPFLIIVCHNNIACLYLIMLFTFFMPIVRNTLTISQQ
jgi:hypothetical protein